MGVAVCTGARARAMAPTARGKGETSVRQRKRFKYFSDRFSTFLVSFQNVFAFGGACFLL